MQNRENVLHTWIKTILGKSPYTLSPLTGDASFRRYYRIQYEGLVRIIMDASSEKESITSFIHIAKILKNSGINTPIIYSVNQNEGFILLADFGDKLFSHALNIETFEIYYNNALSTLLTMQNCPTNDPLLPCFDIPFMLKEMGLFQEWFLEGYLSLDLTIDEKRNILSIQENLAKSLSQQPQVFIHRDYHSRNLMLIDDNQPKLGVIDFQDAMVGPITYDLVSILKDCYIAWPREQVLIWVSNFYSDSPLLKNYCLADFIKAFDLCGLQRHLKVLGIFSRLYLRDKKAGYLRDLPLTLKYVLDCTEAYEELHPLHQFLKQRVKLP